MDLIKITEQNYPEVARIYLEGIATGNATFQTTAPDWKSWDESHLKECRILAIEGDQYLGWLH